MSVDVLREREKGRRGGERGEERERRGEILRGLAEVCKSDYVYDSTTGRYGFFQGTLWMA